MKRKGFTLPELLAVIVILAIIALIATPIVMNVVEKSKQASAERAIENLERAAEMYYYEKGTLSELTFTCYSGVCINGDETLEIKGQGPDEGIINISKDGVITLNSILVNGYACYKENDKYTCSKVESDTGSGTLITSNGTNTITINNKTNVLSDYKIYGNSVQETKNLLTFPYQNSDGYTSNGITWTVNNDGSVIANGTATATSNFDVGAFNFEQDKTYTIHHAPSGSSSSTYSLFVDTIKFIYEENYTYKSTSNKSVHMYLTISSGQTVENLKFYPMIVEGDSIDNWQGFELTPEGPIEVESLGDKTNNLFDGKLLNGLYNSAEFTGVSSSTTDNVWKSIKIYLQKGIYTINFGSTVNIPRIVLNNEYISNGPSGITNYTFEVLEDGYVGFSFRNYISNTTIWDTSIPIWITEGSNATNYEPYGYKIPVKVSNRTEEITTNIYLDEPLRKVGYYADYIDFKNKKIVRYIYKDKLSNISFIGKSGISTSNNFYISTLYSSNELNLKPNILISDESTWEFTPHILSETLPSLSWKTMKENNNIYGICITEDQNKTANEIRVAVPTSVATTLTNFNTWLSNNDSDIYYVMLNPEEETIDLPQISTLKGNATLEIDTEISPSNTEVIYYK